MNLRIVKLHLSFADVFDLSLLNLVHIFDLCKKFISHFSDEIFLFIQQLIKHINFLNFIFLHFIAK